MMTSKRLVLIVVAALAVGTIAAVAVAGIGGSAPAKSGPVAQTQLFGEDTIEGSLVSPALSDPAKQQPSLDKFESKNPFVPLVASSSSGTGTGDTGTGGGEQPTSAVVKVNGAQSTVKVGDDVSIFSISAISSSGVTFALPSGQQFDDGSTSVVVGVGESVKVTAKDSGKEYTLYVVSVGYANGGSTGGTGGHTISLVSINEQNGVATCTIEVDGKTYADLEEGETVDTGWGEIKVLTINAGAQTVTVMHGDATITLHAGQVYTK